VFNTFPPQVLFQEVPDEVCLAFTVSGCPLRCKGCHSKDTWPADAGTALTVSSYKNYLSQYGDYITCVLFFGGEWQLQVLIQKLDIARQFGLKTCLYTGLDEVPEKLSKKLTYLKTGPWIRHLGGLNMPTTNQKLIEVSSKRLLNYRFQESQ